MHHFHLQLLGIFAFFTIIWMKERPVVLFVIDGEIAHENPMITEILDNIHLLDEFTSNRSQQVEFAHILANHTNITAQLCDYPNLLALVDMSSYYMADWYRSYASTAGIPYISLVDSSYYHIPLRSSHQDADNNKLSVQPPATDMLKIVAAIVRREEMNNIAIVYDHTFDIQNIPRRLLTNVPAQHMYIRVTGNNTLMESHISRIMRINMNVVFLISSKDNAREFLKKMLRLKENKSNFDPSIFLLTKEYTYFVCGLCKSNRLRLVIISAMPVFQHAEKYRQFIRHTKIDERFDLSRMKVDEALVFDVARYVRQALDRMDSFQSPVYLHCPLQVTPLSPSLNYSSGLVESLAQTSIDGVYGHFSYNDSEQAAKYSLRLDLEEVTIDNGKNNTSLKVTSWTVDNGFSPILPGRSLVQQNKRKRYRVVTVSDLPPFVYKKENGNGTEYIGYCIDLLTKIAEKQNFDYDIYAVDSVGTMDENGVWSGAIRELLDDKADIAVAPISVMAEREDVIDFTVPYYDLVGLTILMKKPSFDYSLVKFLSVLDEEVWGCIIGAFVLFSILISVFDRLSPFSYQNQRSKWSGDGPEPRVFTLKEGIWFCMMSLTPQGGGETPRALSGRLVAATWWLFGFIIIATYTANLAAFLTVSRLETPIESLDDLSKQFKVRYAPMDGSIAMTYFRRMALIEDRFYKIWKDMSLNDNLDAVERAKLAVWDYPVSDKYTKLWENMKKTGFPVNKTDAIQRVLEEDFAFIGDATTNKYQTRINCQLSEVGEEFSRKPYALAVQEGSPLRSSLSDEILKLINERVLEELKSTWWRRDEKQCPKIEDESDGISIRNIGGVFLVIVIGSGLSLITLACECYWYRLRPGRRNSPQKETASSTRPPPFPETALKYKEKEKEADDNTTNSKKEQSGLDAGFVSILDSGLTNNAFELVERF